MKNENISDRWLQNDSKKIVNSELIAQVESSGQFAIPIETALLIDLVQSLRIRRPIKFQEVPYWNGRGTAARVSTKEPEEGSTQAMSSAASLDGGLVNNVHPLGLARQTGTVVDMEDQ